MNSAVLKRFEKKLRYVWTDNVPARESSEERIRSNLATLLSPPEIGTIGKLLNGRLCARIIGIVREIDVTQKGHPITLYGLTSAFGARECRRCSNCKLMRISSFHVERQSRLGIH